MTVGWDRHACTHSLEWLGPEGLGDSLAHPSLCRSFAGGHREEAGDHGGRHPPKLT